MVRSLNSPALLPTEPSYTRPADFRTCLDITTDRTPELYFWEVLLHVRRHGRSRNKELHADFVIAVNNVEKYSCYVIVRSIYNHFIEFIEPLNMAAGRD